SLDHLAHSLDGLDGYCARKVLELEVLTTGALSSAEAQAIASWVGAGCAGGAISRGTGEAVSADLPGPPLDLRVYVRPLTVRAAQKAGTPRPPVLAVLALRPFASTEDERGTLERAFEDRPQVVVVGNPEEPHV